MWDSFCVGVIPVDHLQNRKGKKEMDETTQTSEKQFKCSAKAKSWSIKILLMIIAIMLFQIPIFIVNELSSERMKRQNIVYEEISAAWGRKQLVSMFYTAEKEEYFADPDPRNFS